MLFRSPVIQIVRNHPVYQTQEARQQIEWLAQRRGPTDVVLVWYWAAPAFEWYAPRYGLATSNTIAGGCWPAEPRNFLHDLESLRGRPRVWLLVQAAFRPEAKLLFEFADQIGTRLEGVSWRPDLETRLYDFSDTMRLQRASASTFPVPQTRPSRFHLMSCPLGLFTIRE